MNQFFNLADGIKIVYGIRKSAIYDLNSESVFSIDENGTNLLKQIELLIPLDSLDLPTEVEYGSVKEFFLDLKRKGIGSFESKPRQRVKENSQKQPTATLDTLWLELTERCNLNCIHCYCGARLKHKKSKELSLSKWKSIVVEAAEISCKQLTLIGGEPFLHPACVELTEFARTLVGIQTVEVFTNGTLCRPDQLRALAAADVNFALSVYASHSALHDKITGVPGSFDRTICALDFLNSEGATFRIACIAMRKNQNEVSRTIRWLRQKYPKANVGFDAVRPIGKGCCPDIAPDGCHLRSTAVEMPFAGVSKINFWRRHYGHNCQWGKLAVTNQGLVRPCVMDLDVNLGDLKVTALKKILESDPLRKVWRFSKDNVSVCSKCEFKFACEDCPPRTASIAGNRWAKPTNCTYDPSADFHIV